MKEADLRKNSEEEVRSIISEVSNGGDGMLTGCLGQRYLGCGLRSGRLYLKGTPGNGLAAYLEGGSVYVDGNAQDAAADTMNDGLVAIKGSAGDALSYGMRGGRVYVLGSTGYRTGVHMKAYKDRKSVLVIGGRTGSFLGEYLAGGVIIVLGLSGEGPITGYFCGNGMYAGTIYLRTDDIPKCLSDSLSVHAVDDDEKETSIMPFVREFASLFSLDAEKIMESRFIAIEADGSVVRGQHYAAV